MTTAVGSFPNPTDIVIRFLLKLLIIDWKLGKE
jgi:hypothetical protein